MLGLCHCNISQYTHAHEKTSTLWLYFGCATHNSGACQFTVPTRLRTIDLVDCFTFAKPKSAIFAVPFDVIKIFDDLQSRCMTDGFRVCKYSKPRAMSSIRLSWNWLSLCDLVENQSRTYGFVKRRGRHIPNIIEEVTI